MVPNVTGGLLRSMLRSILPERASVILPCFNEARTLGAIIAEAKKSWRVGEVIVVDDGSTDASAAVAEESGARLVRHRKNLGKGAAIMSGARAAKNSVLVFIDSDLEDFSHEVIDKLVAPVIRREAGICKATFERDSGRVTELVAKPLLDVVYPETRLAQPLSGQFCIRRELLLSLDVPVGWGIDISIVLSALKKGEKIAEVGIGELKHKHRELSSLAGTAREVTRTIMQNAGFLAKNHKLIIFDFDGTLVEGSSIGHVFRAAGMGRKLAKLKKQFQAGRITERELTRRIAMALRGTRVEELEIMASGIRPARHARETLEYLKRMGYRLAVVSFAFSAVINTVFPKNCFDIAISPVLQAKDGVLTGRAGMPPFRSRRHAFSKGMAARHLLRKLCVKPSEAIAVGNSLSDEGMFREVATSVSVGPKKKPAATMKVRSLAELLVIAN